MRTISILLFAFLLSASAYAQEETAKEFLEDYAFQHCNVLIGSFVYELPAWRDEGVVPLARAKKTLDEIIAGDPAVNMPTTQAGLDVWRSAVASTPQDMADWNAAIESIYNSKITAKQIDRALRKYCTAHTKHVFRASDLNDLLSKSKSQQKQSQALTDFERCKQNKVCYCSNLGSVYENSAKFRDDNFSPEQAFRLLAGVYGKTFSDKVIKNAINQVYFDSGFFYAGGHVLQDQMMNICLGNIKPFKPLK